MKRNVLCAAGLAALFTWAPAAPGAVLCKKKSGVVVVRDSCKKRETPLDPVVLGLQGPKGDSGPKGDQGPPGPNALPCISQVGTDVFFTGCNVHIRSGSGSTDGSINGLGVSVNGLGNLIIGYNAHTLGQGPGGSHNLVIGDEHTYSAYGGLVAGWGNSVTAPFASVTGGACNLAGFGTVPEGCTAAVFDGPSFSGASASVSAGFNNVASGWAASVSGGAYNAAKGEVSSVSGGGSNAAVVFESSVSGGEMNTATGGAAWIGGGRDNVAGDGFDASVSGGSNNVAAGMAATVSGGTLNMADGQFASVSGGTGNTATGQAASVSGGNTNFAIGPADSVSGGMCNQTSFSHPRACQLVAGAASVSGGLDNVAAGSAASVSGGMGVVAGGAVEWHAGQTAGFPTGTEY